MSKTKKTDRGFDEYADILDSYGARVRVTQSSADPLDKVWVFVDGGTLSAPMPGDHLRYLYACGGKPVALTWQEVEQHPDNAALEKIPQRAAAHLNVRQARQLRDALSAFIRKQARR